MAKAILITGATGKQGGAVLKNLANHPSSNDFTLLAVTRNITSSSAQKILYDHPTARLVQGDLNDIEGLFRAAKSVLRDAQLDDSIWGVYAVLASVGPGVTYDSEIAQGRTLIDQSISEGVKHFVYSSVERGGNEKSFTTGTPIPHFQTKYHIEKYLLQQAGAKGQKMGWTILRPVAFMDNLAPGIQTKVFLAALRDSLQNKPMQWISVDDIGIFGARVFREPEVWNAQAEGLAGDELTFTELSACFERVTGAPAPVTFGLLGSVLLWAVSELKTMITWFRTDGYGVNIAKLKGKEKKLCGFEQWLAERSAWATN